MKELRISDKSKTFECEVCYDAEYTEEFGGKVLLTLILKRDHSTEEIFIDWVRNKPFLNIFWRAIEFRGHVQSIKFMHISRDVNSGDHCLEVQIEGVRSWL